MTFLTDPVYWIWIGTIGTHVHVSPDRILVPLVRENRPLGGAVVTHGLAAPPAVMLSQTNSLLFIHRLHIPEKWSAIAGMLNV